MNLFELEHSRVSFKPEALLINEFKAVWDKDTTRTKDKAATELAYVYYMTDFKSVYKQYDEAVRPIKIATDLGLGKSWKPDAVLSKAIDKYDELQQTPSMGLLKDAETAIEKIRQYFREVDVTDDDTGRKTTTLIQNIEKLGPLIKGLSVLREIVEKEINESVRIRGGSKTSARELPPTKRQIT